MPDRPLPPRRKRYRGTHPRHFEERYKELDPARYPDELDKVARRGQTPAGTHIPVLLREVLGVLRPAPGEVLMDATLGYGGHAEALAARIGPAGVLVGLDLDGETLARTRARLAGRGIAVRTRHANFAGIGKVLAAEGLAGVDMLLADLGVSSMQLDDPDRGFSAKRDGPLDMRMDSSRSQPASKWLFSIEEAALAGVLREFGEEPDSVKVAAAIRAAFDGGRPPRTTRELAALILEAKGIDPRTFRQRSAYESHPAARTFQAIRMAVNREPEALAALLRDLPWCLASGGRAAILTFHSGEARRVEAAFRQGRLAGLYRGGSEEPARPDREECYRNPRARSALLYWVERSPWDGPGLCSPGAADLVE